MGGKNHQRFSNRAGRSSQVRLFAAAVAALMAGLTTAGCTEDNPPPNGTTPSSSPAMTFDEALQRLPMDGTTDVPITWDLAGAPETDEVLAARRSLVFTYAEETMPDKDSLTPVGRFLFTERYYQQILEPFESRTADSGSPMIGPIWVRFMGIEKNSANQATVTFCLDHGYWHWAKQSNAPVRKDRATLQTYVLEKVQTGDGETRWLTDRLRDNDGDREPQYGAECTKWAQHQA